MLLGKRKKNVAMGSQTPQVISLYFRKTRSLLRNKVVLHKLIYLKKKKEKEKLG